MAAAIGGYLEAMRPLLFVNWSKLNARFTALMWAVVVVLAFVVLVHVASAGGPAGHHVTAARLGAALVRAH